MYTKDKLLSHLQRTGYLTNPRIISSFSAINREQFLPSHQHIHAYEDRPLQIGERQTISAPHMVAIMCEVLDIEVGHKILEIGTGSGYHAAIVADLVGHTGHVYSIERFESLALLARKNLQHSNITNATVEIGDGSQGLPQYQPYDRIYVTCAAPEIPQPLLDQLAPNGKLLIPVGDFYCDLRLVKKKGGSLDTNTICGCAFVPLVGKYGY